MEEEIQFGSEYAKSNRAACKLCKNNIVMGALRLAVYVQSPFFDGKVPNWHHFGCFFKKNIPVDTNSIKGFDNLRWDDQQKIKAKMGLVVMNAKDENDEVNKSNEEIDSFLIEYAKSARSKCVNCECKIAKSKVRVQIQSEGWFHLECFSANQETLGFKNSPETIPGYENLEDADKKLTSKLIGNKKKDSSKGIKRKNEKDDHEIKIKEEPEMKKTKDEKLSIEQLLKTQSEEFWKLKDQLNKELYKDQYFKDIILQNDQLIPFNGRDNVLNQLCDIMYFGPLEKCSECKNGQLIYNGKAYNCTGQFSEWTKCFHKTQEPKRLKKFIVSKEYTDEFPFLKKFKFVPRTRLYAQAFDAVDSTMKTEAQKIKESQPLHKMNFSATPKLGKKNPDIKLIIERLGGRFTTSLTEYSCALISNKDQLDKAGKKVVDAQELDVHIVDERFLDDLCTINRSLINPEELILKHNIGTWGSDLKKRIELCVSTNESLKKNSTEEKFVSKSGADSVVRMKIKGGAVVDPESGLEDDAHIYCEPKTNDPLSCVLGLVDITRGTNSYYKLQVIEHDKNKSKWYVFRSWGRVGTTIGGNKLTDYNKKTEALEEFYEQYLSKTGNEWSDRKISGKKPNKFYPLEMDYGDEEEESKTKSKLTDKDFKSSSNLDKSIQDIIKLIFDIENMKRQMKEFEIDLNKMPLGKISTNQIKSAFNILTELTNLIEQKNTQTLILDASNRFYTLIPHDFGMKKPTILNSSELIKEKTDMLNNLLEIEIAYSILKTGKEGAEEDPIDAHFKKLNCSMAVLDRHCEEFNRLVNYVSKTHAATHSSYKLVVHDIIKINRTSEEENFKKFSSLHNRKLLWHGSRVTNFAGILSQGLRIAPPEAPVTGYMFGKGVYFADMVSKSANYCFTNKNNPFGLMLLCEVALGDMYELTCSEYVNKLPKGKHSTKGLGRTHPDPSEYYTDSNGVVIPIGKGVDSGVKNSSLLYNEYIVYDTAQIQMKYLFKMEFKYEY